MTADFARTEAAEEARVRKAREVARWLWECGVRPGEIGGWDELTLRRAGREAARAAGVNAPGSAATWGRVEQLLAMKLEWAVGSEPWSVDATSVGRPEWMPAPRALHPVCEREVNDPGEGADTPAGTTETPLAKNISSADADPETAGPRGAAPGPEMAPDDLADAMERHPAGSSRAPIAPDGAILPPRGWPELVATGLALGPGRLCGVNRCGKPAIAATMTLYRCAEHPPRPGEWGAGLNWTPKTLPCAANRCYCGACPTHRLVPASTIVELVPRDAQDGAQKVRQAARAGRSGR